MPVVQLSYSRMSEMAQVPVPYIRDRLPYLGLDIEHEEGDAVRVEYSPNRPDYSTEYGIVLGLQGMAGTCTGIIPLDVRPSGWAIRADRTVQDVRGAVSGILATGGSLDDHAIGQIISMQEDIHQGLGRQRRKVAIGLHDAGTLEPPISYTTYQDGAFTPLDHKRTMTIPDILRKTPQGRQYGHLVAGGRFPVVVDNAGRIASMPPIINSAHTAISHHTHDIFVDVTGHDIADVERALAVTCVTLQAAGFELHRVDVSGAHNRTPPLETAQMAVRMDVIRNTLGLDIKIQEAAACLGKARLDARAQGDYIMCTIPPYRFDILGEMDIVEEVALGYGIDRMGHTTPQGGRRGRLHHTTMHAGVLDRVMTGMGYTQTASPGLVERMKKGMSPGSVVANPKSEAHAMLRTSLLPGMLDILARNMHETYPHRLYETGWVFGDVESLHMGCVAAHKKASYSVVKSAMLAMMHGIGVQDVRTIPQDAVPFGDGRAAAITIQDVQAGRIGEISAEMLRTFHIRDQISVAAFEVDVELIFGHMRSNDAPQSRRADGSGGAAS